MTQQTRLLTLHEGKTVSHATEQQVAPFAKRKRNRRKRQESNLFCRVVLIRAMLRQFIVGLIERFQLFLSFLSLLFCHSARENTTNGTECNYCREMPFFP